MQDNDIADYLAEHPEFFNRHPDLLATLTIRHPHAEHAIPLAERQLLALRDQNRHLNSSLVKLMQYGHVNDTIIQKVQQLSCALLRARDIQAVLSTIINHLKDQFALSAIDVRLWHPAAHSLTEVYLATPLALEDTQPYCRASAPELAFNTTLASFAYLPLCCTTDCFGTLILGSDNASHFTPEMENDWLQLIADLASAALERTLLPVPP